MGHLLSADVLVDVGSNGPEVGAMQWTPGQRREVTDPGLVSGDARCDQVSGAMGSILERTPVASA